MFPYKLLYCRHDAYYAGWSPYSVVLHPPTSDTWIASNHICLHKDFWDRQGVNIATCKKGMYGERLFRRPKNDFFERDHRFFATDSSEMGVARFCSNMFEICSEI